jgi:exosome complex component CSL4
MDEHFMPGDVVRAKLMALGDRQSTYFSTIGAELGVVFALDPFTKEILSPVDQNHMRNPSNGTVYKRKVAKPDQVE